MFRLFRDQTFAQVDNYKNDTNICFINKKGIKINAVKMKEGRSSCLKLDALPYDKRTQAVVLYGKMPIISKLKNDELGLIDNQRYILTKIEFDTITVEDGFLKTN